MLKSLLIGFLIPPVGCATLALAGLAAPGRFRGAGRILSAVSLCALLLLATPFVSRLLLASLAPPATALPAIPPQAIVILGGDVARGGGPGPFLAPGPLSLERLRAGASLARESGLPVLVSGGPLNNDSVALSSLMARSLTADFRLPPPWEESRSTTTWENAAESAALLRSHGIRSVFVVSHAMHLRRALLAFRHFGIDAVPYPVRTDLYPALEAGQFVPAATAWQQSYFAFHEWVGILAYALR